MATEYLNNKTFEKIIGQFQQSKKDKVKYTFLLKDVEDAYKRKKDRKISAAKEKRLLNVNNTLHAKCIKLHEESKCQLAAAFYTLSENIVRYAKFNLIDQDDAIQEGVMICFEKIDRFDARKGKAFNYMTTCILNHFRQLYRTARNYNELKKRYHDFMQIKVNKVFMKNGKEYPVHKQFG